MTEPGRDVQGHNVSGDVFKNEGAVLQAAEEPACGGYKVQATFSAAAAAVAAGGLEGKVVVDLMARNGMGVRALMPHNPSAIRAVEGSPEMVQLLDILRSDSRDPTTVLNGMQARRILGERLYEETLHALTHAKEDPSSLFRSSGGQIFLETNLDPAFLEFALPKADIAIGNSWLHWRVNALRGGYERQGKSPKAAFQLAFADAMATVRGVLRAKGIAVFLTPADFTWNDRDPERQAWLEAHTMINHPVARRMMAGIIKRLQFFGVDLPPVQTSRLFKKSAMSRLFRSVGFELVKTCVWEGTFRSTVTGMNAIDAFFVRYPLWTGKVSSEVVSPAQKHLIATEVVSELRRTVPVAELLVPIRGYYTLWVVQKQ